MFRFVKSINSVQNFKVNFDKLLLHTNKINELFSNGNLVQESVVSFGFLNESICFSFNGKESELLNILNNQKVAIDGALLSGTKLGDTFLVSNYVRKQGYFITLFQIFNWNLKKVVTSKNPINFGSFCRNINSFIFQSSIGTLSSLSLLSGEQEWELHLEEYGRIVSVIGHYNDVIVVQMQSEESKHLLIGIDVSTGSLVWQFNLLSLPLFKPAHGHINPQYKIHLDAEKGIVHYIGQLYATYNILTQEVNLLIDYSEVSYDSYINVIHEGKAYCVGRNRALGKSDGLGWWLLNLETLLIEFELYPPEWQKDKVLTLNDIQVGCNKVYVHDVSNAVLYVYERE